MPGSHAKPPEKDRNSPSSPSYAASSVLTVTAVEQQQTYMHQLSTKRITDKTTVMDTVHSSG
jgi:hypothetical protein